MSKKICKLFSNGCKIFRKKYFWTLVVENLRTLILNMAKIHIQLVKKEVSDVLSSKKQWLTTMYAFKLERKKEFFYEIYQMENFLNPPVEERAGLVKRTPFLFFI